MFLSTLFDQVLWLADNNISCLEGLSTLGRLRELNLARNDILVIGDCLSNNTSLEVLNLADNCIGSFKVCAEFKKMCSLHSFSYVTTC